MNEHNENLELHADATVGEILRNARTTGRRKREIQTISKLLCIREEFLQALEDGNYNAIPETVYILGFARNYAMELGLNPDEIVNKLKRELGLGGDCDESDEPDAISCAVPDNNEKSGKNVIQHVIKFVRKHWIWFVCALVAVIAGVISLVVLVPHSDVVPGATVATTDVVVADNAADAQYNLAVRERFGTENAADARVVLQATQESWVKIADRGGDTVFSRVLVPGDVYYVPMGDEYTATFGNAGGIDVWVDDALAPKQGADHVRVSGISLNPDSLMAEK